MTDESPPKRPPRSWVPRVSLQTLLLIAGAVAALAAIILATSALSAPRQELPPLVSEAGSRDYQEALEALSSGDTTKAAELLKRVVKEDPDNAEARSRLKKLTSDRAQASLPDLPSDDDGNDGNDGGSTPPPSPDEGFDAPVSDLSRLLPLTVQGYQPGSITGDNADALRPFDPASSGPKDVARLLFAVHDLGSRAKAGSFVQSVSRSAYPSAGATVTVNGVPAYFGGNGGNVYTVSYSRGRFAFELILTAKVGTAGATAKSRATAAASAFPTHP